MSVTFTKEQLLEACHRGWRAFALSLLERAENAEAEIQLITAPAESTGGVFLAMKAERDQARRELESVLYDAESVMSLLAEHGASIIPHLMDDDENPGERLRQAVRRARERGGRG